MYHVKNKITCVDACSLYPSAMWYMYGFLEGCPKVVTSIYYDFSKGQGVYFIRINIISLHKHSDFPLTSKIDEDGVRNFTNNMEHDIIYIDKVGV